MVPSWLSANPRVVKGLPFGRDQQFVVNPNGVPELLEELKQCPVHKPTPLQSLPALAARFGVGEIRVKDESQRFGFGAFKALGGVLGVWSELSSAVGDAYHPSPINVTLSAWPRSGQDTYCETNNHEDARALGQNRQYRTDRSLAGSRSRS